jgi:hypothetical protein
MHWSREIYMSEQSYKISRVIVVLKLTLNLFLPEDLIQETLLQRWSFQHEFSYTRPGI